MHATKAAPATQRFDNCVSTATRFGRVTFPATDFYLSASLLETGDYCRGEQVLYDTLVSAGMTVLDVGANIGMMSLSLSRRIGPSGRVLAFEPCPFTHGLLLENLRLNAIGNVDARREIVSDIGGKGSYVDPDADRIEMTNYGALSVHSHDRLGWGRMVETPKVTVDDLGLSACDFIKIDVEGHEDHVVRGARRTIDRFRPMLSLEVGHPHQRGDWFGALAGAGYAVYAVAIRIVTAPNFKKRGIADLTSAHCVQAICLPPGHGSEGFVARFSPTPLPDEAAFRRMLERLERLGR